ncbi:hypothetical protein F25303_14102 [Fusarium sp. NRRL 25303]|nr:hypothetical protein F25303_14102 [Fusarium sp. NRRL 25303]
MCFAGPDSDFLEELDRLLHAIEPNPVPKCLQGLRFYEPAVEMSCSDNDTDDEGSESMRELAREVRVRMYAKAGIDIIAVEAKRQERRERRARRRQAREERREARAAESNNTKSALPLSHNHASKPSSNATEANATGDQAKNQKRKRQTEDEQDQPRHKISKPSDTTTDRPKRRIRPTFKPQASYSPPQTPSPTKRENTQGQAVSPSSPESLVAQQPTPEVDSYLKVGRGQDLPIAVAELSPG